MNDSDSPWEIISSEYLHKAPWLTVRKDHVVLPNGNHIPSYYILEYPDWVNNRHHARRAIRFYPPVPTWPARDIL